MDWLTDLTVGDVLLIAGGATTFGVAVRKAWPRARDFVLFLTDLMGTPSRNGQPPKPGLMQSVAELSERVARVEVGVTEAASAAVTANGKADHLSGQVSDVKEQLVRVAEAQHALAAEQTQIRSAVERLRTEGTDATDTTGGSTT